MSQPSRGVARGAIVLLLTILSTPAMAQVLTKAEAVSTGTGTWAVDIASDTDFNASDVTSTSFKLVDIDTLRSIAVTVEPLSMPPAGQTRRSLRLNADAAVALPTSGHFHFFAFNMTFEGKAPDAEIQRPVKLPTVTAGRQTLVKTPLPNKPTRPLEAADGKDDANFYLAGEINTAKGSKGTGSIEAKAEYPWHRDHFGRTNRFTLFYDLNASTDPNADPDSTNFGLHWLLPVRKRKFSGANREKQNARRLFLENTGKIEAEHDFDNANLLWQPRFLETLPLINKKGVALYFEPYAGSELGANLANPVDQARHRFIARALAGTDMLLLFRFSENALLKKISVESSFVRRWPLRDEITFRTDDSGNIFALPLGTQPRDHASFKLNFDWTKFFGTSIGYEWGELPPSYKLVNHKLKIGFVYKSKLK